MHKCYVESYGVLSILNKTPSLIEVVNDYNSEIFEFFKYLRCKVCSEKTKKFLNKIKNYDLDEVYSRFKSVLIEHLNPLDIILRYDSIDTLHYIDTDLNEELIEIIKNLKGKIILKGKIYENI